MKFGILTLDDFDFRAKTVLCRLDLNSPFEKDKYALKDTSRIKAAIPTIEELSAKGAKLVLLSHQGGDLEYHNFKPTELHAKEISRLTGKKVKFIDDVCGPAARQTIKELQSGEILLLDNVRYMAEEMTLFETKLRLSPEAQAKTIVVAKLAPLADIYICDAFAAAHRDQPTLVGFEELLPSAMGRLFEKEYNALSKVMTAPEKPCIFLLGGAKIEDAFLMMPAVLKNNVADKILCGGLVANIFMMARGIPLGVPSESLILGKKLEPYVEHAKRIWEAYAEKILLPLDYAYRLEGRKEIDTDRLPADHLIADIGRKTIQAYKEEISKAKTVFVNGPPGIFEEPETELGTRELWHHTGAAGNFSVIGGGDSISALNKYGLSDKFSYICTGGGAMVRFLSGDELPVVTALKKAALKFKG
ncbi:MAG: phosphoglycerate kinase [Candidatus Aminicenantes bacterium RBG_19FT_COMBO_58_17]|nr:MAG: phosphoglycerate kinase [Candidatus Aminicenantes bacterium RBG_19FT_COMBO_58_17]